MPDAPAHLCIVRHGETDWNAQGILQGWLDVPLNDLGRRQARELAAAFAASGFERLYSSPLVRALETAAIITAALHLPPPLRHDGLKERNFGVIQGIPKAELAELNPALVEKIVKRNPAAQFEDGEQMEEFADRVLGAVMDIGAAHPGGTLLVITHGWTMDVIARHVRGLPRHAILHVKPRNGESLWVEATRDAVRGKLAAHDHEPFRPHPPSLAA